LVKKLSLQFIREKKKKDASTARTLTERGSSEATSEKWRRSKGEEARSKKLRKLHKGGRTIR